MEGFAQNVLQFHGNGKHRHNWINLKDTFRVHYQLVEQAAITKDEQTGQTLLLSCAHEISSTYRASLIVTLMLSYQMEHLSEESNDIFITEVSQFFDYITPQEAECASEEVAKLAHTVTRLAIENRCPAKVIPSLSRLSSTVSPSPICLSAIHADVLRACIAGNMHSYAHDFVSQAPILEISPKQCHLEATDFLNYFYYSGCVFIAVKDFKKALDCFNEVLAFPVDFLVPVCVDAYKKAMLVSLILKGKAFSLPSEAARIVKRMSNAVEGDTTDSFSVTLDPYRSIEKQFCANKLQSSTLQEELISITLATDSNTEVAEETLQALYSHRIRRISRTYISISLTKLTALVGGDFTPERIETKLIEMNKKELIFAKINNLTGIVVFHDLSEKYQDSMDLVLRMQNHLSDASALNDKLRSMQQEVLSSDMFLKKSIMAAVGKSKGGGMSISLGDGEGDMMDLLDAHDYEM